MQNYRIIFLKVNKTLKIIRLTKKMIIIMRKFKKKKKKYHDKNLNFHSFKKYLKI